MKCSWKLLLGLLWLSVGWGVASSRATVVTDNNLTITGLPGLTNAGGTTATISNFASVTNRLVAMRTTTTFLSGSSPANGYYIDNLAPVGGALAQNFFNPMSQYIGVSQTHNLLAPVSGTSTLTYRLNIGQNFDGSGFKQYSFGATDSSFYQPAGADVGLIHKTTGNLVPNASFENPDAIFFSGGGGVTIEADPGKQGANVIVLRSTADNYIQLPVVPGKEYAYSFWYKINTDNYGNAEWGLSPPASGATTAPGNSTTPGFPTFVNWTEVTGTFIPQTGQNFFYIGGMRTTVVADGTIRFDSLFLSEIVPEPSTAFLLLTGGGVIWRRRRALRP